MNLQTSFLTPPFGFSLFYLKGVAPPSVKTTHIYKGVLPFIAIQVIILLILTFFPEFFGISQTF
jgi:TRAP-type mannitol/chloroaromatic compound transport system permease large subunit